MKTLTTITVDGDEQQAWEVYSDETKERTIGFIFCDKIAEALENLLRETKPSD